MKESCLEAKGCRKWSIYSETLYEKKKVEIFQSNLRKNVFRPKQHVYVNVFRETHNNV